MPYASKWIHASMWMPRASCVDVNASCMNVDASYIDVDALCIEVDASCMVNSPIVV